MTPVPDGAHSLEANNGEPSADPVVRSAASVASNGGPSHVGAARSSSVPSDAHDAAAPTGDPPRRPAAPLRGTSLKRFNRAVRRAARDEGRQLLFVLESVNYPVNVGSLFRIADGCGGAVLLAGTTPDPDSPTAAKVARGHHAHVPWSRTDDVGAALAK